MTEPGTGEAPSEKGPGEAVAIGLGSNVGDRLAHLTHAVTGLAREITVDAASSVYESDPVGYEDQPRFLNAVVMGRSSLSPGALLAVCHALEVRAGRTRRVPGGPRTLDVDLLLYGDLVRETSAPILPHPRWRERSFVLAPLAEIAPSRVDPETGRTVLDIWSAKKDRLPPVRLVARPDALWRSES